VPRPKIHDEQLRQQLLEAAGRIVAAEGAAALSLRRIAADVGTSTTAIYSLFGGKGELVREVWLEGFRRLAARVDAVPRTDNSLNDLAEAGQAYRQHALENPAFYEIMFRGAIEGFEPSDADRVEAQASLMSMTAAVSRCIDDGYVAGDPNKIAGALWAMSHGLVSLELHGYLGSPPEATEQFEFAMTLSAFGFVPRPA